MIKLAILTVSIKVVLSCRGGDVGTTTEAPETTTEINVTTTDIPFYVKDHGLITEFWTPTPEMQAKWHNWYKKWYRQQLNITKIENNMTESDYDDPNRPASWKGLKPGRKPQDIPLWAVIPEDSGKPHICFLRPIKGHCGDHETRWGYNPYLRQCVRFTYSGCGGNSNNFYKKRRCEESCVFTGISNCLLYGRRVNC